jgi:hypothetical protein
MTNIFTGISEEELLPLASEMTFNKAYGLTHETIKDQCLIWTLLQNNEPGEVVVRLNGKHNDLQERIQPALNNSFYLLPLSAVEDYLNHFPENSDKILKYIDKNEE